MGTRTLILGWIWIMDEGATVPLTIPGHAKPLACWRTRKVGFKLNLGTLRPLPCCTPYCVQ